MNGVSSLPASESGGVEPWSTSRRKRRTNESFGCQRHDRLGTAGTARLPVIDDNDHGSDALQVLRGVAAWAAASSAVVVTSVMPLGFGNEVLLSGLTEAELAGAMPEVAPRARQGL